MSYHRSVHSHHQPDEGLVVPTTPHRRRTGEGLNNIIRSLESRWNLGLSVRGPDWSPSTSAKTLADKVFGQIKLIYFSSEPALHRTLDEFSAYASNYPQAGRLEYLFVLLRKASGSAGRKVSGYESPQNDPPKTLRSPFPNQILDRDGEFTRIQNIRAEADPAQYANAFATRSGTPTDEEDNAFATPPTSPTLAAKAPNRRIQASPQVPNPGAANLFRSSISKKKRPPDRSGEDENSPKFSKTSNGKQPREPEREFAMPRQPSRRTSPFVSTTPAVPMPASQKSAASAATSFSTIFSHSGYRDTTANTSFATEITDGDDVCYPNIAPSNFTFIGSLENDEFINALNTLESSDEPLSQPLNDLSLHATLDVSPQKIGAEIPTEDLQKVSPSRQTAQTSLPPSPSKTRLVQHQVRDLPHQGLFVDDIPPSMRKAPFIVRWETCRIALENKIRPIQLMDTYHEECSDYDSFSELIANNPECRKKVLDSKKAWLSADNNFVGYTFKGKLGFNPTNTGPLFKLSLETLQQELSCRFQRAFGSDRFLYLTVPPLNSRTIPGHLKNQVEHLQQRYDEWLLAGHSFLGRKWRVFHVEPGRKQKKSARRVTDEDYGQRLVLFATSGCDLVPVRKGDKKDKKATRGKETSIFELINWFMSLEINSQQPFPKAYARLDLGLSRTFPALEFKPSQIRMVPDTYANNTPEDEQFNDESFSWHEHHDPADRIVMNDGCSRMSVGAIRLIWKMLEKAGPIPSVFQGRIGGAKGVWMLSAPVTTEDPEHLDIWIEITESQLKFKPHEEDLSDEMYDRNRLTFEVCNHSSPATAADLHLAFIPILVDRAGVGQKKKLAKLMSDRLDFARDELVNLLTSPKLVRKWVHEQDSRKEERFRDLDKPRCQVGLPQPLGEKIVFLLESGFSLETCGYLATQFQRYLGSQLKWMQEKLTIPLGKATILYGVADPLGILKPGEIHVGFSTSFFDRLSSESCPNLDKREVLVSRQPACRRSDMQKVCATFKYELAHLVDVVVFPSLGAFPLGGKLQGGDYDGDLFWICWERDLVAPFKNAPAPTQSPLPATYGIAVERRTLRDVTEGNITNVDGFLRECFQFKNAPSLLGICTNFHENLCYYENRIDSNGINALSDMHDLLVDSSKQGYKLDHAGFRQVIQRIPSIKKKEYPVPAFRRHIKASEEAADMIARKDLKKESWKWNPENAIDSIYFETVIPHNEETLLIVEEILGHADGPDPDLQRPYLTENMTLDPIIKKELESLYKRLEEGPGKIWTSCMNPNREKINSDNYNETLERCWASYKAITPENKSYPEIRFWERKITSWAPTLWDVLKASALACIPKFYIRPSFIYHMAGSELGYIKASGDPYARLMTWQMFGGLKPRKMKTVVGRGEQEDIYEDAPEESAGI
ncbi:hypothetical protein K432DRAFT_409803 [Lepidopterella palustris CBS 459.81]|uniref:RNA-dependent RNA polymerase n=1 Tax=Lepidopterella palustris CBS 459.81 TaxID=1314670 RepID=A0A8E2JA74_9PEZI|nr:hypothetical protein K432DRAFT_409803 [Lepidopterella palustris CBS 459.81]